MSRIALVRIVLSATVLSLAWPMFAPAQVMPPEEMPEETGPPPNYECAAEPVTGSGPGFSASREDSEAAAIEAWHEKAKAIHPDAAWDTAKDAGVSCAVQGLYSKCFAQGIPCHPKEGADAEEGASAPEDDPAAAAEGE